MIILVVLLMVLLLLLLLLRVLLALALVRVLVAGSACECGAAVGSAVGSVVGPVSLFALGVTEVLVLRRPLIGHVGKLGRMLGARVGDNVNVKLECNILELVSWAHRQAKRATIIIHTMRANQS